MEENGRLARHYALIAEAQGEDAQRAEAATAALLSENMGLVRNAALRFRDRGTEYEDLVQIGCIGMLRAIRTFDLLTESSDQLDKLNENTLYFRNKLKEAGFDIAEGVHPIVPVMLYDAKTAQEFAARMLQKGVYVVGFCYPVVPQGKARIRTQVSAAHSREDLDFALKCFIEVRNEMGL